MELDNINLKKWRTMPSSLIIPVKKCGVYKCQEPDFYMQRLAVVYYLRECVCIHFPAFVCLLGRDYTGREIEAAWQRLPLIKFGKPFRGTSAGPL